MPKSKAKTLLLIANSRVMRADVDGSGTKVWQADMSASGQLPAAAEFALSLGPKPHREILVLTTTAWTQSISVNAQSIAQLDSDELTETLKFEVEPFSGIGAFESIAANVELVSDSPDQRAFWVTQLSNGEVSLLEDVIRACGGRLMGVGHPAGIPASIGGDVAWQRTEFWPELVATLCPGPQIEISNSDPRTDRWLTSSTLAQSATTESLIAPGVAVPHEHLGSNPVRLDDETQAEQWFKTWASCVSGDSLTAPIVVPEAKPVSRQTFITRAIFVGVAALALCMAHLIYAKTIVALINRKIGDPGNPVAQQKQYNDALKKVNKDLKNLREELTAADKDVARLEAISANRSRFANLLHVLAEIRSDDLVIEQITPTTDGLEISGTSLTSDAATRVGGRLRKRIASDWDVQPPTQIGRNQLSNGGPWEFAIVLMDSGQCGAEANQENDVLTAAN